MTKWTVEHAENRVPIVRVDFPKTSDEFWLLMRSDAHWDNPDSDQKLMKRHLELALERNAGIIDGGDFFCAMQGKYDKRSDKSKVRPEHQSGDYLDRLVKTAVEFHKPYAKNWVGQWLGNHDTGITKNHETCLITRMAESLREKTGAIFPVVGYSGWENLAREIARKISEEEYERQRHLNMACRNAGM